MTETFVVRVEDIPDLAERVVEIMKESKKGRGVVLFLEGDLGAGKTTFTKELAALLGIDKEEVHSPTFILKKEYGATNLHFRRLVHVDAYRFNTPEEAKVLQLKNDIIKPDSVIAIEWPSRLSNITPDVVLDFQVVDDDTREVTISY